MPEEDPETTETRERPAEPEPESQRDQPEPGTEPETEPEGRSAQEQPELRIPHRSQGREQSSDRSTGPEPEPLYVTPQLPPAFVLNELDTTRFLRDEPARLRVCDDQFKVSS